MTEAFEAQIKKQFPTVIDEFLIGRRKDGKYASLLVEHAWTAFQAATAAERERAARVCEEWAKDHAQPGDCTYEDCDFVAAAHDCADKIRSGE